LNERRRQQSIGFFLRRSKAGRGQIIGESSDEEQRAQKQEEANPKA